MHPSHRVAWCLPNPPGQVYAFQVTRVRPRGMNEKTPGGAGTVPVPCVATVCVPAQKTPGEPGPGTGYREKDTGRGSRDTHYRLPPVFLNSTRCVPCVSRLPRCLFTGTRRGINC